MRGTLRNESSFLKYAAGWMKSMPQAVLHAWKRLHTKRKAEAAPEQEEQVQLKRQTIKGLRNREFKMYLQFIVDGKTEEIIGAEALSRWAHPQKGLLPPGKYIRLMETEKIIAELDFYLFEEVCRQLEKWQREGRSLRLSCNFTRITIGYETFLPKLKKIAGQYDFDHERLVIEITEDVMEDNKEKAFENISRCKEMGFGIALDDAGSGYTSFSDLREYPIDVVKIDRSILQGAATERGAALLKGMIALVHCMEMKVLCEGVETEEQAALLRRLDCDYIQGYYFYRALPRKEAERILREQTGGTKAE